MDRSKIEWTDATWNPVRGCSRVSAGCVNCYAERMAWRSNKTAYKDLVHWKNGGPKWTGEVRELPELLDQPLRWRRPRRVFVNSMSDLFHLHVTTAFIDRVLAVMLLSPDHTFQVLTKRPDLMREYFADPGLYRRVLRVADQEFRTKRPDLGDIGIDNPSSSLPPWIWLGVSVEDQQTADERIPLLLDTPAGVRWVSYEPALGPIDFNRVELIADSRRRCGIRLDVLAGKYLESGMPSEYRVDWIVVGGESGPGARPFQIQWARDTVRQCQAAGVPVFVKQLGAKPRGWCASLLSADAERRAEFDADPTFCDFYEAHEGNCVGKCQMLTNKKGGDMSEWPEDLRVREYPA